MAINLLPSIIKDIERLQRYERIFQWLLKRETFSKQEIVTYIPIPQETFKVIFLDSANQVIDMKNLVSLAKKRIISSAIIQITPLLSLRLKQLTKILVMDSNRQWNMQRYSTSNLSIQQMVIVLLNTTTLPENRPNWMSSQRLMSCGDC